jgi:hypothetical protein
MRLCSLRDPKFARSPALFVISTPSQDRSAVGELPDPRINLAPYPGKFAIPVI